MTKFKCPKCGFVTEVDETKYNLDLVCCGGCMCMMLTEVDKDGNRIITETN